MTKEEIYTVYVVTEKPTGRCYTSYCRGKVSCNWATKRSIVGNSIYKKLREKCNYKDFEITILKQVPTVEEAVKLTEEAIAKFECFTKGFNKRTKCVRGKGNSIKCKQLKRQGRPFSEETCERMSKVRRGRALSEDHRREIIRIANSANQFKPRYEVYVNNKLYSSLREASDAVGIKYSTFRSYVLGINEIPESLKHLDIHLKDKSVVRAEYKVNL